MSTKIPMKDMIWQKLELKSPLEKMKANLENGKKMYDIYCASCHGKKGDGNGYLVQREKIGGVPAYNDAGEKYHRRKYLPRVDVWKRNHGIHSSQLTIQRTLANRSIC